MLKIVLVPNPSTFPRWSVFSCISVAANRCTHTHYYLTNIYDIHFRCMQLAECVHSRLRVDLDRRNVFIQSFHISTCKQNAYCLFY